MVAVSEVAAATALVLPASDRQARLAECLSDLSALHRHICPRQVLGVRIAMHAGEILGIDLPRRDKRLFVLIETDGCFADAVSVASGAWLGHRTLRLVDHGKVAATFVDTEARRAIRVWPHPEARGRARDLVPHAPDRWHAQLEGYQLLPTAELLGAEEVFLTIDLDGIRSRPGVRASCGDCREEIVNERQVIVADRALCRDCAGDGYYRRSSKGRPD